jgi:carbamoyl-phosphate synthase small subunit
MKGYLHLENGECFEGKLEMNGSSSFVIGEVVFFTGMTGYQEVLTDPSYKGQIIVFTYPLIGNYGINADDFESRKPQVRGVIVYECKSKGYHYKAEHSLPEYLRKWNIPILSGVDTRSLVKCIRQKGTMMGKLSFHPNETFEKPNITSKSLLVKEVSSNNIVTYGKGNTHIVLIDFGYKKSILTMLLQRNCKVTVVPYNTSYETIKQLSPDGILLSNGPGDPKQLGPYLLNIKKIIESYPTFAICLGHQLVALAFGGNTEKLTFGHRGANHPVVDIEKNKVFITSQNHSYVVEDKSLVSTGLKSRFINVNDGSIEGLTHESLPILTVQFHPEAHPGPNESSWIFDEFLTSISTSGREKVYA